MRVYVYVGDVCPGRSRVQLDGTMDAGVVEEVERVRLLELGFVIVSVGFGIFNSV